MELIKTTNFDFLGKRKYAYTFSLLVIIAGGVVFFSRGVKNNLGIDFIGGDLLQIEFQEKVKPVEISEKLKSLNNITVQSLGTEEKEVIIKSPPGTSEAIVSLLQNSLGTESFVVKANSSISPSMSATLSKKAIEAFLLGLLGIMLYLTFRFEYRFAVAATVAILHDMLFAAASLALLKKPIDGSVLAALLTIAGFSVNDTVVIFDRIRETLKKTKTTDYAPIFNRSINETLSRTIITTLTVLFVVLCLFLFGGESLHTFSLTLLIGFVIGTYSTVFVASALVIDWNKISPHRLKL